jgi:hypothetical protein
MASLLVTVSVARQSDVLDFASFAFAGLVYSLVSGCLRAAFVENTIVALGDLDVAARQLHRLTLTSVALAFAVGVSGVVFESPYMIWLALALPGLCILDYARIVDMAVSDARRGILLSLTWSLPVAAVSAASMLFAIPAMIVYCTWAGWGAILGISAAKAQGLSLRPAWPPGPTSEVRTSAAFTLDFAVGSGGASATTLLLGPLIATSAIGALRGASTLLGPVTLVASSARSLVLPHLVRSGRDAASSDLHAARRAALLLAAIVIPCLMILSLLPARLGQELLGSTFATARPLIPPLAIEVCAAVIGGVAAAGHRSRAAGRRALTVRLCLGIPRPLLVGLTAVQFGVEGAAWSMAAVSVVNAVAWWLSFANLHQQTAISRIGNLS